MTPEGTTRRARRPRNKSRIPKNACQNRGGSLNSGVPEEVSMALHAVRLEPAPTPVPAEPARLPATIEFRRFAGSFPTGVAVATTRDRSGQVFGTTMNALTSLSLDPPTYLMCFGTQSNT